MKQLRLDSKKFFKENQLQFDILKFILSVNKKDIIRNLITSDVILRNIVDRM